MKAAKALHPYGFGTYCFATYEENTAAITKDWTAYALKLDEATGLPEILASYTKAVNKLDNATAFIGYMPRDPEKMIGEIMAIVVEARAILAKHTA